MPATTLVRETDDTGVQAAFDEAEAHFGHVPNLVRALGTNPAMCKSITAFLVQSLGPGRVPWAFKELVILKTLRAVGSFYSYGAHERLALELGNPEEKVGDLANSLWQNSPHFDDGERAVLALVEQIGIDANGVSEELWARLRSHWDSGQLVELTAVITTFVMIGRVADCLGVSDVHLFSRSVA